jgi:hypothetical protein
MTTRLGISRAVSRSETDGEDGERAVQSNPSTASPPLILKDVPAARAAVAADGEDVREAIFKEQVVFIESLGFRVHPQELIYAPLSTELAERLAISLTQVRGSDERCRALTIKLTEEGLLRDEYCPSWFTENFNCAACGTVPNRPLYAQANICPWCERRAKNKSIAA